MALPAIVILIERYPCSPDSTPSIRRFFGRSGVRTRHADHKLETTHFRLRWPQNCDRHICEDTTVVPSHVENALEKSKQEAEKNEREAEIQLEKIKLSQIEREAEIQLEKIKLSQIEKQLELAKVRKESEKNSQSCESGEPSSITDKLESLLIHFSRDKTRNPTPTSNLNLDAPTFVPGQIEGSVEANSQSEFVATGVCALADDKFNIPDRIDMLLGAEIFYELLKPGKFYCDNSHLVLQNTVFGYVVSGSVDHTQVTENRVHCGLIVDDDLKKTLKKFWEIEGVHIEPKVDTEVSLCEDHFVRTHTRNCEGRYVVSMALNKDPSCLGNSKDIAIRRLNSLWKRLSRDSSYLSLYAEFLKEYEELGHLERVVESSEPPTH
ncbi:DUF1758 domain-containing protein [Trichonephila clavipes]|nr:DUF1758 domain-containing protein [Trichonephila clavipes]